MASINSVINMQLLAEGKAAARDNMNVVCIMTSEQSALSTSNRYGIYKQASAVEQAFGSLSDVTAFANAVFGTQPNPVTAGGTLVVGYWRAGSETTPETKSVLTGAQIDEPTLINAIRMIDRGAYKFELDSVDKASNDIDFTGVGTIGDVLALLNSGLTDAEFTYENSRFIVTADTAGANNDITYLQDAEVADNAEINAILGLKDGSGATIEQGQDQGTLAPESRAEALAAVKAQVNFKGVMFIDNIIDEKVEEVASWAQANAVIAYEVFSGSDYLQTNQNNPAWRVVLSGQSNFRCLYSSANNRKYAASYMARAHVVNFNAENSAMTMHLKSLSVAAENYSEQVIEQAKTVGLDLYTTIKDVPVVLTSGANDFVDNVYNLTAFVDAVQTDMFNLLAGTATKLSQTRQDVNKMVDQGEKTTRGFARAGVFAPGTWSSPDTFGNYITFTRAIERQGYYWLAGELSDQSQSDRQARKSPVLQCAVKNAGAIHSADIIINFNY